MSKRMSGALLAAALAAFSVVLFLQTFKVRNFPGTRFGAEIWPRAILICLGALALVLLVQSLRCPSGPDAAAEPDEAHLGLAQIIAREGIALTVFACFAGFLWLVPRIGAYPAGGLFVMAILTALGPKTPRAALMHLGISIGMTLVLWGLFAHLLKVIAPVGRWWSLL
jgi:hypothetical protein